MRGLKNIQQAHDENTGLGYFPFRIKEGEGPKVVRVLLPADKIEALYIHNEFKVINSTRCTSDDDIRDPNCPLCRAGVTRSLRTYIPVRVKGDDKVGRVQIIEYGRNNLQEVQGLIAECPDGDITQVACEVKRQGKGTSTQYRWKVMANSTRPLNSDELAMEIPEMAEIIPIKDMAALEKLAMQYQRAKGVTPTDDGAADGGDADADYNEADEVPF